MPILLSVWFSFFSSAIGFESPLRAIYNLKFDTPIDNLPISTIDEAGSFRDNQANLKVRSRSYGRRGALLDKWADAQSVLATACISCGAASFLAFGLLFIHQSSAAASAELWIFVDRIVLSLGYLVASLVPVFFMRILKPLSISKSYPALALAVVGVFFSSFAHLAPTISVPISIMGALFVGIEYALLTLMWTDLLGNIGFKRIAYCLGWALILLSISYFLINSFSKLVATILTALMPVFSTILLKICHQRIPSAYEIADEENRSHWSWWKKISFRWPWRTSNLASLTKQLIITTAVFGFVFAFTDIRFGMTGSEGLGFGLAGLYLVISQTCIKTDDSSAYHYRVVQPCMIGGLTSLIIAPSIGMGVICFSYSIILVMLLASICTLSKVIRTPIVKLATLGLGANVIACIFGEILGQIPLPTTGSALVLTIGILEVIFVSYLAFSPSDGGFAIKLTSSVDQASTVNEASLPSPLNSFTAQELADVNVIAYREAINFNCSKLAAHSNLTVREEEVLALIMQDASIQLVAEKLVISPHTVKTHINHIYKKLNVSSRDELKSLIGL